MNQKTPKFKGHDVDAPKDDAEQVRKLPEWVRCYKCKKPPVGFNWLKPVSADPECRVFIHLDCITPGLSNLYEGQRQ